ncbi:ABC transporter ATP-binding protein [Parvularcula marina]|uniref:ABC transporter ATP-binding protein n=1 Tax=Parvularcula marina TaxID=2292771 RepID=UPI003518F1BA
MNFSIETSGLSKRYGSVRAVDGIDLQVPEGSVFGFLGPNGSGKTTTLRMLLGLIRPNRGRVRVNGADLGSNRYAALGKVGAIVEQPALYPTLTGRQTLRMHATLIGRGRGEVEEILALVGLTHAANRKSKGYSLGMRQRLAIGRALLGKPQLLILDEPTNGLDPSGIAEVRELIKSLPERTGTTVLLSSHLLSEVEQMADTCALINKGKLLFQGPLEELKASAGAFLIAEVDDPARAAEVFTNSGLEPNIRGSFVEARCDWDKKGRAALLAALVCAGIEVSYFELKQPQLENVFLELTKPGGEG